MMYSDDLVGLKTSCDAIVILANTVGLKSDIMRTNRYVDQGEDTRERVQTMM